MDLQRRNNVSVMGNGPATLIFSHDFGCDQTMWGYLFPVCLATNIGQCPQRSVPNTCSKAMNSFLSPWIGAHVDR